MKIINAIVNNVDVILESIETIIENQVNNAKMTISFDETWKEYDKYVVFKDSDLNTYKVAVINDEVIIPSELKSGFVNFQIYGQIVENDVISKRQPTKISGFLLENSLSPDGLDISIPSSTEWDNYIKQIENITNRIVSDEDTRVLNEKIRIQNEEIRIQNENNRTNSEDERIKSEDLRKQNETTRNSNEKTRIASEDTRIISENERIKSESTRTENEATRVSNEKIRIQNEENREEYITQLKQDVKDGKFNGECNFATFNINYETGELEMNKTEDLLLNFDINKDGELEVNI